MAEKSAPVIVKQVEDGFELKLVGTIPADLSSIEQEINRVIAAKPKRVYVDLAACEFISSVGMGALVSLHTRLRASGGSLKIVAIRKLVFGSFRIGRLDQLFGISPEAIIGK